ncbi:hypothetical protein [Prosthecobacter sp.]|uniref:hypothetical protein n=1 Tax=Prosthecobacter sp. TaxID=1965333 RepID=UPI002ABAA15C|nr:hypothetical protein [Prosthecobacter sp.]MDZ4403158.1 hypothetical protein [Prosthecobacter sp.]
MKSSSRILVVGLLVSLASALAIILCACLVFEHWLGDTQPLIGYAFALVVAAGVFCIGFIVTIVVAVSEISHGAARHRGGLNAPAERDIHGEADEQTPQ